MQKSSATDVNTDSSKIHDELLRLQKLASENNVNDSIFLECLSLLAPKITKTDQLEEWFKAYVNPAINSAGHRNDVVEASQKFFLSVLENGTSPLAKKRLENEEEGPPDLDTSDIIVIETPSQLYFYWILEIYQGSISKYFSFKEIDLSLAERKRFIVQNAKNILSEYGTLRTPEFFVNLNKKALQPENRLVVLSLISSFIGGYDKTELSAVANTGFLDTVYNCLLYDNSFTTLNVCINILSMLIPHVTSSLYLPKLLVIFGRVASWYSQKTLDLDSAISDNLIQSPRRKSRSCSNSNSNNSSQVLDDITELELNDSNTTGQNTKNPDKDDTTVIKNEEDLSTSISKEGIADISDLASVIESSSGKNWKILDQVFEIPDLRYADISPLFTALYGLFPFNVLAFSNSPSEFLSSVNYSDPLPENWVNYQISMSMKALFPLYSLNPYMSTFNKEQEISDTTRWSRMGSAKDLAMHCLNLRIPEFGANLQPELSASGNNVEVIGHSQKRTSRSRSLLDSVESAYALDEPGSNSGTGTESQTDSPNVNAFFPSMSGSTGNLTASSTTSRISSPINMPRGSNLMSYLSPTLKNVESLLSEHHQLFQRRTTTDESMSVIPDNVSLYDSNLNATVRRKNLSSSISSPLINPLSTTKDAMIGSPLLIAQAEPSSSITPLTVSSPVVTGVNYPSTQRNDTDPEPLRLSPLSVPSISNDSDKTEDVQSMVQKRIQKQHANSSSDSSLLFYQRELMLLQNEFDFVLYLERHSQYKYYKLLDDRSKDAIYNDSIGDLIAANQMLRKKVYSLEQISTQAQRRMKKIQNDRQNYESSLLQRNRDMRTTQQELSRKISKLEIQLEKTQNESNELFDSIIKKETIISEMEFRITELTNDSSLAGSYKKALAEADEKIINLKQKTSNFLSPDEKEQMLNFLVRIKELTSARDAAEYSRKTSEMQFKLQIAKFQAQIKDYQEKQRNPSSKLKQSFDSFKQSANDQYALLSEAHQDLTERFSRLSDKYEQCIAAYEISRNRHRQNNSHVTPLLSPDSSREFGSASNMVPFFSEPGPSRSLTSDPSGGLTPRAPSPQLQSNSVSAVTMDRRSMTLPVQVEHQTRIRGRGGVQNALRTREQQENSPRSGHGQFRGPM